MIEKRVTIINKTGLHARAASSLVKEANKFDSEIKLNFKGKEADGKSILAILALGVDKDDEVIFKISGRDEKRAAGEIKKIIDRGF